MAEDNVIPFKGDGRVGDGVAFHPDHILDAVKEQKLARIVVCGYADDGEFRMYSSHSSREAMWMLNKGIGHLLYETE